MEILVHPQMVSVPVSLVPGLAQGCHMSAMKDITSGVRGQELANLVDSGLQSLRNVKVSYCPWYTKC